MTASTVAGSAEQASAGESRVQANRTVTRRLGHWTRSRRIEVRSHRGKAVVDLRSPRIPAGDIHIDVDLDHAVLTLLVADDAVIDDWDLRFTRRGRRKDSRDGDSSGAGRRIVVTGEVSHGEVRVHRGGVAMLTAMWSREFLVDAWRSHRQGRRPTVDDPTRVV